MLQHLRGIAEPFAVLLRRRLYRINLSGGYEVCQPLLAADYMNGVFLAERHSRHDKQDVLQQYLFRVDLFNLAFTHFISPLRHRHIYLPCLCLLSTFYPSLLAR